MAKQIKVSDEVYDRLKADADQNYRSMGGHIEYLMDKAMGVSIVLGEKRAFTETPPSQENTSTKSLGDILANIRDLEGKRDEELRYCQDDDYRKEITNRYASFIQPLWDEYSLLKG